MSSGQHITQNDFLKKLKEKNINNVEVIGKYEKYDKQVKCKCKSCGYIWYPTPKSLYKGRGCPKCANNVKLTNEEFKELLNKRNKNSNEIELLEVYNGMSKRIKCRCQKCGTIWNPKANDLIRAASGCPSCSGNIFYTHDRFVQELKLRNSNFKNFEVLEKYNGSTNRIKCRCMICNNEWNPIASSLLQGTGCPICAKIRVAEKAKEYLKSHRFPSQILSNDEFIERLKKNPYSDSIEIVSNYKGARKEVTCICKKCGNKWKTTATSLMNGSGCPRCVRSSTSFMEQCIKNALEYVLDIEVLNRDKSIIGKEIDIVIPQHKLGIEIGSWKWHKKVYVADLEKKRLCEKIGYKLLIIYDSYDEESIKDDDIYTYAKDIGTEKSYKTIKSIIEMILEKINVKHKISESAWNKIINKSYLDSQRISNKDFLKKLKLNNDSYDNIEILSTYTRAKGKIKWKCKICNNIWESDASELLKGRGCKTCKNKQVGLKARKENIIKEWRKNNPNGSKLQCEKDTGISRMTVYKWWNS